MIVVLVVGMATGTSLRQSKMVPRVELGRWSSRARLKRLMWLTYRIARMTADPVFNPITVHPVRKAWPAVWTGLCRTLIVCRLQYLQSDCAGQVLEIQIERGNC